MECYEQYRSASISRYIFVYNTSRRVQAGKEDGTVKIDLPFLQHQAPVNRGFLFGGGWVDLDMKNILARGGIEFLAVFLGIALSLWVDFNL